MTSTSILRLWGGLLLGLAVCGARAQAEPPKIDGTAPYGAPRGSQTEVAINGADLGGNPRLIAPFGFKIEPSANGKSDGANWRFRITIDPSTAVGTHLIRVRTDGGLSNPFPFATGQLPQVAEVEPNNAFDGAQTMPFPTIVEGQAAGADVDFFKFAGKKGERIVVDAQCARIGSGVDPMIRLTTARRKFVASAEDSPGLATDARLTAVLPEDGEYVVEISDSKYSGAGRAIYRLTIGQIPVAEEVFPLGGRRGETVGFELRGDALNGDSAPRIAAQTLAGSTASPFEAQLLKAGGPDARYDIETSAPLEVGDLPEHREPSDPQAAPLRVLAPAVINGRLESKGDEDRFVIAATPGQSYRFEIRAASLGSALDGQLQLLNPSGAVLATADDTTTTDTAKKAVTTISPDPSLDFAIPNGINEVTVVVRDLHGRGGAGYPYRLVIQPKPSAFALELNEAQISIPKGGSAVVGVAVKRQGYNGPIEVTLANPPAGLTVRPGKIADGQTVGSFSVAAAPDSAVEYAILNVVGKGNGDARALASKSLVFATQGAWVVNAATQQGLAAATSDAPPLAFEAPEGPLQVAHGGSIKIPVKVIRQPNAAADLTFNPLPLPAGLTAPDLKIAGKDNEAALTVSALPPIPLGVMTLAWSAKGKIGDANRVLGVPAITIEVVRPVVLSLAAPALEVKPGQTVEIKGKVERKGGFAEPVEVKIAGLPAGVKLEPASVTVAANASDFVFKAVADAKAAAAMVKPTAAVALKINKQDYAIPPSPFDFKVAP